jgi:hypothetical protein
MENQEIRNEVSSAYIGLNRKILEIEVFEYQVIVLCSFLDQGLTELLELYLREPINKESKLDLSLSGRISLCYQLGFFEEEICVVYDQLRKLRNKYSHQIEGKQQSEAGNITNVLDGDSEVTSALNDLWEEEVIPLVNGNIFELSAEELEQVKFLTICMVHIAGLKKAKSTLKLNSQ